MNPDDRKYTREHEWVVSEAGGSAALVGITQLRAGSTGRCGCTWRWQGVGDSVGYLAKMGEIESVKAVSDLYSPISGEVTEVNGRLAQEPELVNNDPFGDGWMLGVSMTDPAELDSAAVTPPPTRNTSVSCNRVPENSL